MLKNLTRLWPGSSSTLTGNKRKQAQNKNKRQHSTNEAAPKAVRELSAMGGERAGQEKLEALTVFSQKIQAQEKRGIRKGKGGSRAQGRVKEQKRGRESKSKRGGVERGAGSPGTSLARKTRSQRERRKRSRVRGNYATRGNIVE